MKKVMFKNTECAIKDIDEKKGIVTFYANAFNNVDSDGDVSVPGSFKKTIKENGSRIKHFLNHDPTKLVGVILELKEDDFGLLTVSQLNMKKQLGKDTFEDYKLYAEHGKTLEHSIRVEDIKRDKDDEKKVLEWRLWEVSTLYSWGANEKTPLIEIKSMDDLELMMREGHYSDEKAKKIEELYNQLKQLIGQPEALGNEPQTTVESDVEQFLKLIKI